MKTALLSGFLFALLSASGCTALQKGTPVVKYEKNDAAPRVTEVSMNGTYALYSSNDLSPQVTVPLEKGDKIGFRRDDSSGRLVAVAGSRDPIPLNDSQSYYWKRQE